MAQDDKSSAENYGMEHRDRIEDVDKSVIAMMPRLVAHKYCTVPSAYEISGSRKCLKVAISDPLDVDTVDSLRYIMKTDVEPVVVPEVEIEAALSRFYGEPGAEDL